MRCSICRKIFKDSPLSYKAHLRVHKLSLEETEKEIKRQFPGWGGYRKSYRFLKLKIKRGEKLTNEEFSIVNNHEEVQEVRRYSFKVNSVHVRGRIGINL